MGAGALAFFKFPGIPGYSQSGKALASSSLLRLTYYASGASLEESPVASSPYLSISDHLCISSCGFCPETSQGRGNAIHWEAEARVFQRRDQAFLTFQKQWGNSGTV